MEAIDHIVSFLALLLGGLAAWFSRRGSRNAARASLEAVVRDAVDYAQAHPSVGVPLDRTAFEAAKRLDIQADGKRDFSDAALGIAIKAELARRGR